MRKKERKKQKGKKDKHIQRRVNRTYKFEDDGCITEINLFLILILDSCLWTCFISFQSRKGIRLLSSELIALEVMFLLLTCKFFSILTRKE